MKKIRRLAALLLAMMMVFTLVSCSGNSGSASSAPSSGAPETSTPASTETYKIIVGGTVPDEHPISQALFKFKEVAESLSGGSIQVEVYDNNTLGGSRELVEAVQSGEIQMCESSQSAYASFTEELMSVGIPFLFKNREAAYAFYDSEVGEQIANAVASDTGIRIVGYFENGVRQLTNSKRPVVTPDDLSGLKIRVMESPLYIEMFTEMGANPMPMSFAELYTALQQGTVDGQDNPYAITCTNAFYEVQKYMTDLSHTFDVTCFSINDDFYQNLPDDIRDIVDKAAAEATELERQLSIDNEASYIKTIEDQGVQLTRLTDEQRQAFKDKCTGIYDFFRANYNPSVTLDTVLAKAEEVNAAN